MNYETSKYVTLYNLLLFISLRLRVKTPGRVIETQFSYKTKKSWIISNDSSLLRVNTGKGRQG